MAKSSNAKSKRRGNRKRQSVSRARPRSFSEMYQGPEARQAPAPAQTTAPKAKKEEHVVASRAVLKGSETVAWDQEYRFVFKDLRYLLAVSAGLFLLEIVIGFLF